MNNCLGELFAWATNWTLQASWRWEKRQAKALVCTTYTGTTWLKLGIKTTWCMEKDCAYLHWADMRIFLAWHFNLYIWIGRNALGFEWWRRMVKTPLEHGGKGGLILEAMVILNQVYSTSSMVEMQSTFNLPVTVVNSIATLLSCNAASLLRCVYCADDMGARERAAKTAAASRRWREYSRQNAGRRSVYSLPPKSGARDESESEVAVK